MVRVCPFAIIGIMCENINISAQGNKDRDLGLLGSSYDEARQEKAEGLRKV
jgi:hypothetical protein